MTPNILFEDPYILVCLKPAGIPVQSRMLSQPDMVSILKNHLSAESSKKQAPYLAVIHRLDQPVEGILVFGKTPKAAQELNRQLQTEGFGKHYRALLHGTPAILEATLTDYIVKDGRTNTSRICPPDTPRAKLAQLHYRIIQSNQAFSIAEIKLVTGRHHQIRVQMAHIGCPIVGDRKYGAYSKSSDRTSSFPSQKLQLFAYCLEFVHPCTNKPLRFEIDRLDTKLL